MAKQENVNKAIAVLLVLTVIVMLAGIALNMPASLPTQNPGASGKVNVYVTAKISSPSTGGKVSLVVE